MLLPGWRSGADRAQRVLGGALILASALGGVGCAPEIGGRASFPILSRAPLPNYEQVTPVDEKRCSHVVMFLVGWGDDANHEALVTDILVKHNGDAIADAELTFHSIPAFFYNRNCARVRGTVVRRSGAPAAVTPPAVTAPPAGAKSGEVTP